MMLDATAKGVFPIAPTPFLADGGIDWASIDRLCDFYVGVGSTGLTVLGVMGEAPKLDGAESLAVATRFIRRAAGLPVVVGVSAPGFAAMRTLARAAMAAGAAGVMIAPPSHLRTDDQIVAYYGQAAEANWPGRAVRPPGLPAELHGRDDPGCPPPHHHRQPGLRDAQARGLARPRQDLDAAQLAA